MDLRDRCKQRGNFFLAEHCIESRAKHSFQILGVARAAFSFLMRRVEGFGTFCGTEYMKWIDRLTLRWCASVYQASMSGIYVSNSNISAFFANRFPSVTLRR